VHHPFAHGKEGIGIHPVIEGVKRGGLGANEEIEKGEEKAIENEQAISGSSFYPSARSISKFHLFFISLPAFWINYALKC
jgi:hypothetical protein